MKYKIFPAVSEDVVKKYIGLSEELNFTRAEGSKRRVGRNKQNGLSIYKYSKWFNWGFKQRDLYRTLIGEHRAARNIQCWYMKVPAGDGFLDVMDYWVTHDSACSVVSVALKGDQSIWIDDEEVVVKKGEAIGFKLNTLHEIKPSENGQMWACIMSRDHFSTL